MFVIDHDIPTRDLPHAGLLEPRPVGPLGLDFLLDLRGGCGSSLHGLMLFFKVPDADQSQFEDLYRFLIHTIDKNYETLGLIRRWLILRFFCYQTLLSRYFTKL